MVYRFTEAVTVWSQSSNCWPLVLDRRTIVTGTGVDPNTSMLCLGASHVIGFAHACSTAHDWLQLASTQALPFSVLYHNRSIRQNTVLIVQ